MDPSDLPSVWDADPVRVEVLAAGDERLDAVVALYKRNAATLGFMPRGGFEVRSEAGTLLVAVDGPDLRGYLLYDLPRREVVIRHLCVAPNARGKGVARRLVDHLVSLHGDRTGIGLSCRDDYPAAQMWPRLDFEPLAKLAGRSRDGHRLTRWWRDFNHPTLFSSYAERPESMVAAALDTDVFLDLVAPGERADPRESLRLLDDWVTERAELFITKEISVETTEQTRRMSLRFPRRDVAAEVWEPIAERLASVLASRSGGTLSPHDESDARHIARAAAVGGAYFLTRDRPLRRRLAQASIDAGIKVVFPGEFLAELDEVSDYAPVLLEDTTFSIRPIGTFAFPELVSRFLNYSAGERKKDFEARLRQAIDPGPFSDISVIADEASQPVALFARSYGEGTVQVPVLRVAGSLGRTLSRHLVHMQPTFRRSADPFSLNFATSSRRARRRVG